jgi:hypothetical protein
VLLTGSDSAGFSIGIDFDLALPAHKPKAKPNVS